MTLPQGFIRRVSMVNFVYGRKQYSDDRYNSKQSTGIELSLAIVIGNQRLTWPIFDIDSTEWWRIRIASVWLIRDWICRKHPRATLQPSYWICYNSQTRDGYWCEIFAELWRGQNELRMLGQILNLQKLATLWISWGEQVEGRQSANDKGFEYRNGAIIK